ncbi:hypothetical protein [Lentzea sp. CA-135723]|uniref:hypothetical protein n=1 Tax=Lentzea sp. CA-135723 TaxID=3239950 RepID=UPI003D9387B2
MSGEETQAKGADGVRRAKLYLESTTRANVQWVNPDKVAVPKLSFEWANDKTFSFDMGGILLGGELQGQEFLAECKYYTSAQDQGTHYRRFLAQCYRAYNLRPDRCDKFLWVTWSPFLVNDWGDLMTSEWVRDCVLMHRERVFNVANKEQAAELVSGDACKDVSERLGMVFISEFQEKLTLSREHLGVIRQYDTNKGDR